MTIMAIQTMVMFSNDATEIRFSDGSRLQLSPCGACFTFWKSGGHTRPSPLLSLLSSQRIQQRTRYAVSEYKAKVLKALEFRNQFAAHPYLCADIIDPHYFVHIYSDIQEASWPASYTDADVKRLPDGTIQITSIDQCASLKLAVTRCQFSVEFLCKVPREAIQGKPGCKGDADSKDTHHGYASQNALQRTKTSKADYASVVSSSTTGMLRDKVSEDVEASLSEVNPGNLACGRTVGNVYVWVVQHCSIDDCPPYWRHPLQMALRMGTTDIPKGTGKKCMAAQKGDGVQDETLCSTTSSVPADLVHTPLPCALAVNCPANHMHVWKDSKVHLDNTVGEDTHALEIEYAANYGVKIFMISGVIYRVLPNPDCDASLEVYPGDNTIIKSHERAGALAGDAFFTHFLAAHDGIEQRVYCTNNMPPERPGCQYSTASILARASRLLQLARLHPDVTGQQVCWKINHQPVILPSPTNSRVLLEERHVANVGRFSAYSDGYIRIAFTDRTLLDWRCDLSQCISRCLHKTQGDTVMYQEPHKLPHTGRSQMRNIPSVQCRLLLPSGQYTWIDMQQPTIEFQRYVFIAEEWRVWVNLEPSERTSFYNEQFMSDPYRVVNDELKKIQHFTYMAGCLLPKPPNSESSVSTEPFNLDEQRLCRASKNRERHIQSSETISVTHNNIADVASMDEETDVRSDMSPGMIRDALAKTAEAIVSIDSLLDH